MIRLVELGRVVRVCRVITAVLCALGLTSALCAQDTLVINAVRRPEWGASPVLVEEARIGTLGGEGAEAFGRVSAVAVAPSGEIIVVDQHGPALRVFDWDGRFVRDLGGPGQGPGEFSRIAGVRITPEGRVAIWDPGNQRITVYDIDGAVATVIRVESGVQGGEEPFQIDTSGTFYVSAVALRRDRVLDRSVWIRVSAAGEVLDSVPVPRPDSNGRRLGLLAPGGAISPFTVETIAALSPHGYLVAGRTDRYAITRPLSDGRIVRIQRVSEPIPIGEEERRQWEAILHYAASFGPPSGEPFAPLPSRKPVFRRLWVDEEGRFWVQRYAAAVHVPLSPEELSKRQGRPPLEWREPPVWDVIDERGAFWGSVTLPLNAFPAAAHGSHVWVVEEGEYGESYVVRYRVQAGTQR
jgi:hypothetical protein